MAAFAPADAIRGAFSDAMSAMYRAEVPLYGELLAIVAEVNARTLAAAPELRARMAASGEAGRLGAERHGAIRVGTAAELAALRRIFAVMGMAPVGYYDLAPAGVPVHSTAFRPIDRRHLTANPFRIFTSLLRLDLVEDVALREKAAAILVARRIVPAEAMALVERFEADGGLTPEEATRFVAAVLEIFRWHANALVDLATYERLGAAHRLLADVVAFRGPHINHLTPRTLDIDAAQAAMRAGGLEAKAVIEGPPPRAVPLLLRQTSFKALEEPIRFGEGAAARAGTHSARFGEIEQRGAALTRKGRALYDDCLSAAGPGGDAGHGARLARAFAAFPDDETTLRRAGLAFFRHLPTEAGRAAAARGETARTDLETALARGWARVEPIVYEDFLPVSAAGIFQSNLGDGGRATYSTGSAQAAFEEALGAPVADPFTLYEAAAAAADAACLAALSIRQPIGA